MAELELAEVTQKWSDLPDDPNKVDDYTIEDDEEWNEIFELLYLELEKYKC